MFGLQRVRQNASAGIGLSREIEQQCHCTVNLSIKDTLNKGHLSNEGTVCSPNHKELCINLRLNYGYLSMQDSQLGPSGVLYRFRGSLY